MFKNDGSKCRFASACATVKFSGVETSTRYIIVWSNASQTAGSFIYFGRVCDTKKTRKNRQRRAVCGIRVHNTLIFMSVWNTRAPTHTSAHHVNSELSRWIRLTFFSSLNTDNILKMSIERKEYRKRLITSTHARAYTLISKGFVCRWAITIVADLISLR